MNSYFRIGGGAPFLHGIGGIVLLVESLEGVVDSGHRSFLSFVFLSSGFFLSSSHILPDGWKVNSCWIILVPVLPCGWMTGIDSLVNLLCGWRIVPCGWKVCTSVIPSSPSVQLVGIGSLVNLPCGWKSVPCGWEV